MLWLMTSSPIHSFHITGPLCGESTDHQWRSFEAPWRSCAWHMCHYSDVIMSTMASQITGVSIVCSTACSGTEQRKHQSSPSLAFVWGIHRGPVNSPHKRPVTQKMFPFDDIIIVMSLSGVPDYFYRNKISSGGDLSHYSSASQY